MIRASLVAWVALVGVARAEIVDPTARYPEGPLWSEGALYVAEMGADAVFEHRAGVKKPFWRSNGCGPTALARYGEGFVVLCHLDRSVVAVNKNGLEQRRWRTDDAGRRLRNPNDVTGDGNGGVFFSDPGVFSIDTRPHGAIMHLTAQGELREVAGPLHYPNGVFFDVAERKLYVSEHLRRRVLRYAVAGDGSLSDGQSFADLNVVTRRVGAYPEAGPDGLERGPDGDLYVCMYGEGRVLRLSRRGEVTRDYVAPTPYLTNIAFGPDGAAYLTGAFDNQTRPFPGAVMRLSLSALSARR